MWIAAQLWSRRFGVTLTIIFAMLLNIVLTVDPQAGGLLPFASP
jgi:hypothetical protein